MSPEGNAVVGIDVGGEKKGFHAVALQNGVFQKTTSTNPTEIVKWCLERKAKNRRRGCPLRLEPIRPVPSGGAGSEIGG